MASDQPPVDLVGMATPIVSCAIHPLGRVIPALVSFLEDNDFDQAPVQDANRSILGVVSTADLRGLVTRGEALTASDSKIRSTSLLPRMAVEPLLEVFSWQRAYLVEGDPGHSGAPSRSIVGLLTISDLNKRQLRNALYPRISVIEIAAAELLDSFCISPWEWIQKLAPEQRAAILGYWELAKRNGNDIGPTAAAELPHLLSAIGMVAPLLDRLRYTASQFNRTRRTLIELRNKIMHPVSPLFHDQESAKLVGNNLNMVTSFWGRVREASHAIENASRPEFGASNSQLLTRPLEGFDSMRRIWSQGVYGVPAGTGVYFVLAPKGHSPSFLAHNPAGSYKGRNPTIPIAEANARWIPSEPVVYIGQSKNLRRRLKLLLQFGHGESVPHWGGRLLWQVRDAADFFVGWYQCPDPSGEERALLKRSVEVYGRTPFANLASPRDR